MAVSHNIAYQDKFSSLPLDSVQLEGNNPKIKVPRRIIHFSDGVLEEYSTDEEDCPDAKPTTVVDPKSLTWLPWCAYYMTSAAKMSLSAAELCGEKLAWLFGITSPKYGYAIEEYKRVQREVEEDKVKETKLQAQAHDNSVFGVQVVEDNKSTPSTGPSLAPKEELAGKF